MFIIFNSINSKARVNINKIIAYERVHNEQGQLVTKVTLDGGTIVCTETPEEIDIAMNQMFIMVKEIPNEQVSNGSTSTSQESISTDMGTSDSGHAPEESRGDQEVRDTVTSA